MRIAALATALIAVASTPAPLRAADAGPCHPVSHEGATFTVCEVDPATVTIRLFQKRPDGSPYALLGGLPRSQGAKRPLLFAMNGGMFKADLSPVGLHIEGGRELSKVSTRNGPGNFHLKPNGVFFVSPDGRPGVLETTAYLKAKPKSDIATQSGPMLVIDGKLHPKFIRAEASQKMRNGVGVDASGHIHFAISEDPVSFAQFGRLYRDVLKCPNALFLDGGSVPTLYAPTLSRGSNFLPIGPMLAVYAR